jgi:hypothetical protein
VDYRAELDVSEKRNKAAEVSQNFGEIYCLHPQCDKSNYDIATAEK